MCSLNEALVKGCCFETEATNTAIEGPWKMKYIGFIAPLSRSVRCIPFCLILYFLCIVFFVFVGLGSLDIQLLVPRYTIYVPQIFCNI